MNLSGLRHYRRVASDTPCPKRVEIELAGVERLGANALTARMRRRQ